MEQLAACRCCIQDAPYCHISISCEKSTSPSIANVAARLIRNLKNVDCEKYVILSVFHCDLCIIAAVLLLILKVYRIDYMFRLSL